MISKSPPASTAGDSGEAARHRLRGPSRRLHPVVRRSTGAVAMLIGALFMTSCGDRIASTPHLTWTPIDSLNARLPASVQAYAGVDLRWPLRAWYVRADLNDSTVHARVVMSDEADAKETTSSLARDLHACVVANGGYFRMDLDPARHVGLLMIDGVLVNGPTPSVIRDEMRYPVARAALGFDRLGHADIGWVSSVNAELVDFDAPISNRQAAPVDSLPRDDARSWPVVDAVAAGPVVISRGRVRITDGEEVFFGSAIPKVHPRTAAGVTKDGELLLLVVDGRQMESSGVDLEDLASILLELGAYEAMNLDGGGSSTLVVNGVRLNVPSGSELEREVMSAIALDCSASP